MIRVLIDTGVWMSYTKHMRDKQNERIQNAQGIFNYLLKHSEFFEICYSERTERELKKYSCNYILKKFSKLPSHILNQTFSETEEVWDNIATRWGNKNEPQLGEHLQKILPDKNSKLNRNDRGIYGDAVLENCNVLIHENPKDFNKFRADSKRRGITLIDLINLELNKAVKILDSIKLAG